MPLAADLSVLVPTDRIRLSTWSNADVELAVFVSVEQFDVDAQGRGTPSDEIRDATGRVPNLWFGDADEHETPRQRFHIEVYVAPEVAEQRIAAALAAGGTVVDDSNAPSLTVIADQDGNKGIVCVDASAANKD